MTDAHDDPDQVSDHAVAVDTELEAAGAPADDAVDQRTRSPYRAPAFAVARAVVVLAVAAVGYQAVVPSTHVIRARLARLTVTEPGVKAYDIKAAGSEVQATQTQLTAVETAAKRSPGATGVYTAQWAPSQASFAVLAVFLLPTPAQATTTLSELRTQQLAAGSDSSSGLTRRSTFAVSSVSGSAGAFFTPSTKSSAAPTTLAVTVFRYGKVVALSEVLSAADSQTDASTVAVNEYSHLRKVEPGFTLNVVRRPGVATALWAAGAVALAALAALGPIARRALARRRQQRLEEELSRRVVVHGQVITKHRR